VLLRERSSALGCDAVPRYPQREKKQLVVTPKDKAKGNHIEAVWLLGIHPKYLHRLIRSPNLRQELKRPG
jgi:hypothetical protein